MSPLEQVDPEIAKAIRAETERQSRNLELIASENFVSEAVLEAVGSVMTNKYAEGYPGKRYYGGCEIVDIAEELAISRARELFGAEHVNVQPHSGSQANMAVYFTLLKPGDVVLGPNLAHGGHLTAGSPINFSGRFYQIVPYGVRKDTERIDLDQVRDLARQHRPKLVIAGGSAFPRAIDFKTGGLITGLLGIAMMPWKLMADPSLYILSWLVGYSGGLGSIAGVLIADYWIVRKKQLRLEDLYLADGAYGGWNWRAVVATLAGCALAWGGLVIPALKPLYDYAWFVGFGVAFALHVLLMRTGYRRENEVAAT